jgi:hypothetical protein
MHLRDKLLQLANQQSEFSLLYELIRQLPQLFFENSHSLFHPFDPRLKLCLLNQPFGIPINQAGHSPLEFVDLRS